MQHNVTIIGAGIVGICCALSLQDRGFAVQLIDPAEPGQETSFGNAGVISPWSIIPQAVPGIWKSIPGMLLGRNRPLRVHPAAWPKMIPWGMRFLAASSETKTRQTADTMEQLCQPSIALFQKHLAGTGHEDLITPSWYIHAFRQADNASLSDLGYAIRRQKGADIALIGPSDLRQLEPALSPRFQAAVVIKGQARARAPGDLARALCDKAQRQGARILRTKVTGLAQTDGGWAIATPLGVQQSAQVVLAAGVWSAELLRPLGLAPPLMAERGYHVEFPHAAAQLNNSIMDVDAKIVASSMLAGLRVAGGAEFAPIDAPANPRRQALLAQQARDMFPDLGSSTPRFWMGRRPSLPDSLPALGEYSGHKGLFAAFGHSHYGLMMAPKSGELIADLLNGAHPNTDLAALNPRRFDRSLGP